MKMSSNSLKMIIKIHMELWSCMICEWVVHEDNVATMDGGVSNIYT